MTGLILDPYDDDRGVILRQIFPRSNAIPDFIKSAADLTRDQMEKLPDDVFGLILVDREGGALRKFACVDEGNTALNVLYFIKTAHVLSQAAREVAAARLEDACEVFHLPFPSSAVELMHKTAQVKTAGIGGWVADKTIGAVGRKLGPLGMLQLPGQLSTVKNQVQQNLAEAAQKGSLVQP